MDHKSIIFIYKHKKIKTKQLIKKIKRYINSSPYGLDFYWFIRYLDLDFILNLIARLEKENNWHGIERVLEMLPYVKNNEIFIDIALRYLQHPNQRLQIAALRFFRITVRHEYLQLFDSLINTNNEFLVKELVETIGYTSPPNAIILLKKIKNRWGNIIPADYYIRAKIEIGITSQL